MSRLEPVGSHELIDSRELTGISKPFAKQPAAPTPKVYLSTRAISILTLAALLTLWWAVTAGAGSSRCSCRRQRMC